MPLVSRWPGPFGGYCIVPLIVRPCLDPGHSWFMDRFVKVSHSLLPRRTLLWRVPVGLAALGFGTGTGGHSRDGTEKQRNRWRVCLGRRAF